MNAKVDVDRKIGAPKNSERETIVPNEGMPSKENESMFIIKALRREALDKFNTDFIKSIGIKLGQIYTVDSYSRYFCDTWLYWDGTRYMLYCEADGVMELYREKDRFVINKYDAEVMAMKEVEVDFWGLVYELVKEPFVHVHEVRYA